MLKSRKLRPPRLNDVLKQRKIGAKARKRRVAKEKKKELRLKWLDGKGWVYSHNRYQIVHVEKRPCAVCGDKRKRYLQCDHILARALGGTHDMDNLQVLCKKCHRKKTKQDLKLIRKARKAGKLYGEEFRCQISAQDAKEKSVKSAKAATM